MIDPWLWLGTCIFLAYTLEAMTGFGSVVIALSLGALVLPIKELLPILVALNICMSGYLTYRHRQLIDWRLLLSLILPGMSVGTLIGFGLGPWLSDGSLKQGFGVLIVWFALRELLRLGKSQPTGRTPLWVTRLQIGAAGISHGLFASGGPLLVYALAATALDKARFRATLVCVWFSLNGLLTLAFLANGSLQPALPRVASYLPLLAIGVLLGEHLHHRVAEQHFRLGIYLLLCITGVLLAWRS
ncbi:sulfite exporter TauE/SafE family protein [Pseudomonas cavernicola]|uniref:Probable membrane transporter protein n=1 Tax=Pseudomonas cavernicola TaxID=2320866 RepID=A0A418XLR6_9PSED|nr:sulfite exporter TauE/SafE family protein [Pseudomonas cavernicola]RJG13418.1 sulfite exporter TauE/SafE family protein [Pseudomonas cavernicola]